LQTAQKQALLPQQLLVALLLVGSWVKVLLLLSQRVLDQRLVQGL
jgi:hypothetical protein